MRFELTKDEHGYLMVYDGREYRYLLVDVPGVSNYGKIILGGKADADT